MGDYADNQQKANICNELFRKAQDHRRKCSYDEHMKELDDYDRNDKHTPAPITWPGCESFYVKTFKTQQYKREIGARLLTSNPQFRASVKDWAGEKAPARAEITEYLINTSVRETDFITDLRNVTDCALGYGRGVARIGMNKKKRLPQIRMYPSKDVWTDPDATNWHQCKFICIRNKTPHFELADMFPEHKHRIYKVAGDMNTGDEEGQSTGEALPTASHMVEWIEMYTLDGCERYTDGMTADHYKKRAGKTGEPRKYVFIKDENFLLYDGEWEIPFHKEAGRQAWPVEFLDFYTRDDTLYPDAPLRPGIPWLRAYNFLQAVMFLKMKRSSADFILALKNNGVEFSRDSWDELLNAEFPVVPIDLNKGTDGLNGDLTDIRKYIQQFSFDSNFSELNAGAENCLRRFEEETGLYQFLYVGDPGTQDRSAAATHLREKYSRSRIDDFINTYEDFLSRVGRKMAITARFWMDDEDVARYMGPEAAEMWGNLMLPEQMDPEFQIKQLIADMPELTEGNASIIATSIMDRGVVMERFLDETDFHVEAGSTKRKTPAEEQAGIEWLTNQLLPTIASMGAPRTVALITTKAVDLLGGMDESEKQIIMQEFDQIAAQQEAMAAAPQPPPQGGMI